VSDLRLRELERSARHDPAARVALLTERLRTAPACERCGGTGWGGGFPDRSKPPCPSCTGTGSPLRARIELAAWCGDEGARTVLPDLQLPTKRSTFAPHERHEAFTGFVAGLSRWVDVGPAPGWVLVRAAVAAARVVLRTCGRGLGVGGQQIEVQRAALAPRRAIEAAEAWLACPCEEHRRVWSHEWLLTSPAAGSRHDPQSDWLPRPLNGWDLRDTPLNCVRLAGEKPVREAIQRALIEWSLS